MKKGVLFAVAALMGASAFGQTVVNNPANEPYFGIRAALDITSPAKVKIGENSKINVFGSSPGFSLGAIYNQPVVANFYVQPGVSLYYNTVGINHDQLKLGNLAKVDHASMRKFGLRVPVMLGYHFDFNPVNIHVFTGPELDVGIVNDYYTEASAGKIDVKKTGTLYGDKAILNRVDCLWKVGVGVEFLDNYYVDVTGAFGLTNQIKNTVNDYPVWRENYVSVTLGYNF